MKISPGALHWVFSTRDIFTILTANSDVYFRALVQQSPGFSAQRDPRVCGNKFS
jgi:hypothetical protein